MTWTPEREQKLAVLWAQGLSCRAIAKQLGGGISRNAVIGKRVRMGLPDRVSPNRNYPTRQQMKQVRSKRTSAPKSKAVTPSTNPEPTRTRGASPGDWNLKFSEAMGRPVCKRFVADESGTDGLVCGTPTPGSWCSECARSIFQPLRLASAA